MDSYEVYDLRRSPITHGRDTRENETFPTLAANGRVKRKIQRHNSYAARSKYTVPEPGNEYDFRRSPECRHKRHPPGTQSSVRPSVPPDTHTRYAIEEYTDEAYATTPVRNHHGRTGAETPRIPTPMPYGVQPQTAWDNDNNVLGGSDLEIPDHFYAEYSVPRHNFMAPKPRTARRRHDVVISDLEDERTQTQTPISPINLTESVINYYFQRKLDKDKRIVKWLVDCEEKSCSTSLPAHLPDISVMRKNIPVSP